MVICKADPSGPATAGKVTKITMRKAIKTLLDRSLLQGSVAAGVKMHVSKDIITHLFEYLVCQGYGSRADANPHWRSNAREATGGGARVRHCKS